VGYFELLENGSSMLGIVQHDGNFQLEMRVALGWLRSMFGERGWGGSFWTTVDVLETLSTFGEDLEPYHDVVVGILRHHDRAGSYDEVLGATCAAYRALYLLGRMNSDRARRARDWIMDRAATCPLYELATVLNTFTSSNEPLSPALVHRYLEELPTAYDETNEFRLLRHFETCSGLAMEFDSWKFAQRLLQQQAPSGAWINVPHTASVILALNAAKDRFGWTKDELDESVFRGVVHLKDRFDHGTGTWGLDELATAKATRAVRSFEQSMRFPVDGVVRLLHDEEGLGRGVIEALSDRVVALQAAANASLVRSAELESERDTAQASLVALRDESEETLKGLGGLAIVLAFVAIPALLTLVYAVSKGGVSAVTDYWSQMAKDWSAAVFAAFPAVPVVLLLWILRRSRAGRNIGKGASP
jgi:hypothetical protein